MSGQTDCAAERVMAAVRKGAAKRGTQRRIEKIDSAEVTPLRADRVDIAAARRFVARHLPGAEVAEKFGNASFSAGGKVFAFTRPDGLVLKLPPEPLSRLLNERQAAPLVMGKRAMREWVHLRLDSSEACRNELSLLRTAMQFVIA